MRTIPGIEYYSAPKAAAYTSALRLPPKLIVVHCTANTANRYGEAKYAATRTDSRGNWTSCHAYIDTEGSLGSLSLDLQAWAAYGWANANGIHLELCGKVNAVPDATQYRAAKLVRQLCDMFGVPRKHLGGAEVRALHDGRTSSGGITGHLDISNADFDRNDHSDPGNRFDWNRFISWVNEGVSPPKPGPILGDDMPAYLARTKKDPAVYKSNGLVRDNVITMDEANILAANGYVWLPAFDDEQLMFRVLGRHISELANAPLVQLSEDQVTRLGNMLVEHLPDTGGASAPEVVSALVASSNFKDLLVTAANEAEDN